MQGPFALTDAIICFPAGEQPLSANVGIVRGERYIWLFDVGASDAAAAYLNALDGEKNVILSHFHADHTANLGRVDYQTLYCGGYTRRKLGTGTAVAEPLTVQDGLRLTIFPLPSVHAKGSVGLLIDDQYAFLGDAVCGAVREGRAVYNAALLRQTILTLAGLDARYFLLSHQMDRPRAKADVLAALNQIYAARRPGEVYIEAEEDLPL